MVMSVSLAILFLIDTPAVSLCCGLSLSSCDLNAKCGIHAPWFKVLPCGSAQVPGVVYINRQRHIPIGWLLTSIDPSEWVANQFYCSSARCPCAFVQLLLL